MPAVLTTILNAVKAKVVSLGLAGVEDANVVRMKVPVDRAQDLPRELYPAILIAPYGAEDMQASAGTNIEDDIGYPILIAILAADLNEQNEETADVYFLWREQLRQAFHNKRLTGASTVYTGVVTPQNIVEASAWFNDSLFVSSMLVKFTSRELRP